MITQNQENCVNKHLYALKPQYEDLTEFQNLLLTSLSFDCSPV